MRAERFGSEYITYWSGYAADAFKLEIEVA
jgi:hypothetical protein